MAEKKERIGELAPTIKYFNSETITLISLGSLMEGTRNCMDQRWVSPIFAAKILNVWVDLVKDSKANLKLTTETWGREPFWDQKDHPAESSLNCQIMESWTK